MAEDTQGTIFLFPCGIQFDLGLTEVGREGCLRKISDYFRIKLPSMALSTYEKYEQYWHILKNNQEMIRFSEVKAGLVISIYGILFSVLLNSSTGIRNEVVDWPWYLFIMIIMFVLVTLLSLYFAFKCFRPRFENKNPTSIIYFGDIVSDFREYKSYHAFLEKTVIDDYEMSIQLAEQIHTNSSIARRKFQAVSKSIKLLLVTIFILILLVALLVIV